MSLDQIIVLAIMIISCVAGALMIRRAEQYTNSKDDNKK